MGCVAVLPCPSIAIATRPQLIHGVHSQFEWLKGLSRPWCLRARWHDWVLCPPWINTATTETSACVLASFFLILNGSFPNIYSLFFRDESLSGSDITSKLEPAFLSGLRCAQPLIRAKFFEVFDSSMKRRVYERLLYICCSQNWEAMGSHFWIKQCIEVQSKAYTEPHLLKGVSPGPGPGEPEHFTCWGFSVL